MIKFPVPHSRVSRSVLAIIYGMALGQGASAQTLEERVKALEEGQASQNQTIETLDELVKRVNVTGFVSVRGGQIDASDVLYLSIYDDNWSFSEESVVGLQVDTNINERLSVSLQMKADGINDGVQLEWGYLEYAFQPDLKMRAGRLRMPGFMLSEYLDVGYAYPWVQVPYEVYGWIPFNHYEGLDLRYWTSIGAADIRISPYIGTTADEVLRLGNVEFTDQSSRVAGLDVQLNYDIFTVRAGYSKYQFELRNSVLDRYLAPLVEGVTLVPGIGPYVEEVKIPGLVDYVEDVMVGDGTTPGSGVLTDVLLGVQTDGDATNDFLIPVLQGEMASLVSQVEPYQNIPPMNGDHNGEFYGVGFNVDNGEYQIMSEFSRSEINGAYPDVESGYVMFGYRFGNWMPHFTVAKMYTVNDDERPDLQPIQVSELLVAAIPGYEQLAAGANQYTGGLLTTMNIIRLEQETYTLGLRWDPTSGFALKAEVFVVELKNGSYGFAIPSSLLQTSQAEITDLADQEFNFGPPEDRVTGVRVSLDMVF